jgi:hypothetical protein
MSVRDVLHLFLLGLIDFSTVNSIINFEVELEAPALVDLVEVEVLRIFLAVIALDFSNYHFVVLYVSIFNVWNVYLGLIFASITVVPDYAIVRSIITSKVDAVVIHWFFFVFLFH